MEKLRKMTNSDRVDRDFRPYREQLSCSNGVYLGGKSCQNLKITLDIETTGLNPWFNKQVTCIGAKTSEGHTFLQSRKENTEEELLKKFMKWFNERYNEGFTTLSTHNGLSFDIPFLLTRMTLNDIKVYPKNPLIKAKQEDSMVPFKGWMKLDNLAIAYGIQNKTGNGKGAIDLYNQERFQELESYCWMDVIITEKVNKEMAERGIFG